VKEPNMFHNYETEKITRKARKPAITAGATTEHVIIAVFFCHVTGFMSGFLGRNNRTTSYNNYNVLFCCSARENHL